MRRKHDFTGNASRCHRCGCAKADAEDIGGPECISDGEVRHNEAARELSEILARLRAQSR